MRINRTDNQRSHPRYVYKNTTDAVLAGLQGVSALRNDEFVSLRVDGMGAGWCEPLSGSTWMRG